MSVLSFLYQQRSTAAGYAARDIQNRINRAARGSRPACACELALEVQEPQVSNGPAVTLFECTCGGKVPIKRRRSTGLLRRISLFLRPEPALPVL